MKYLLLPVIFPILFLSCTTETELEGTWIGAYRSEGSGSNKFIRSLPLLVAFKGDSAVLNYFSEPSQLVPQSAEKVAFEVEDDILIFNGSSYIDSIKILVQTSDSLILETLDSTKTIWVLRKFESCSNTIKKPNLVDNSYVFSFNGINDTIDFLSDSKFISWSRLAHRHPSPNNWAINMYDEDQFLILGYWIDNWPMHIEHFTEDSISLKIEGIKEFHHNLIRLKPKTDISELLVGRWVESWNIPSNNIPPPPPPPCAMWGEDYSNFLIISSDSVHFILCDNTQIKKWKLNSTNQFLCFYDSEGLSESWRIAEFSDNRFLLKRKSAYTDTTFEYRSYDRIE